MLRRNFLKCSTAAFALASLSRSAIADTVSSQQEQWGIRGKYLTIDGKAVFLSGANYIPSHDWYFILRNWNAEFVERDLAALRKLGIISIRFPLLWVLLQPDMGAINTEVLSNVNKLLNIAHRNGITVQVEFFTGAICGATFLPKWADGNIFTDPVIIQGEKRLVSEVIRSVRNNPGLMGYDFGNEVNILARRMKLKPTEEQIRKWMEIIYQTAHAADPHHAIASGFAGYGDSNPFSIWDEATTMDYLTLHSYCFFDATITFDPWIGQRTLYDMNFAIAYQTMTGKPVVVQENGFSEGWIGSNEDIAKCLRLSLVSAWAQGAAGYFWWGSHDNDLHYRIPTEFVTLKYSEPSIREGIMNQLEYSEGLLDTANQPKVYGLEYQHWSSVISKLGVGWTNDLPVLYLLYPEHSVEKSIERVQLTAFTLAKQTHMEVRLWPAWKPVPSDAAAIVIANYGLSKDEKVAVRSYLENGGVVYQSWVNDFADGVAGGETETVTSPVLIASTPENGIPRRNHLPFAVGDHVRVNARLKILNITVADKSDIYVLLSLPPTDPQMNTFRPIFFQVSVGKGTYYYLAANLEEALANVYDPWEEDDSNQIYSAVRPESLISIDSKYVELFAKSRGSERVVALLNRSNRFQDVILWSHQDVHIQDYTTHSQLGAGREVPLQLAPGEVLIAEVENR
jgi:hypothetical protein